MTERDLLHEPCDILIPCAVERVSRLLVLYFCLMSYEVF